MKLALAHKAQPAPSSDWHGLVLGGVKEGPVLAGPQRCALVLGPPRSGKTTAIVIPNVLGAPGAVVSTSTKTDVAEVTAWSRSRRGRCWLFNPLARSSPPAPFTAAYWSPVGGCEHWDTAVAMAHAMVQATRPPEGTFFEGHWRERADALLSPLLHAAALAGLDIGWVLRWVLRRDVNEPAALIKDRGGSALATMVLEGIAITDSRERSGIFSTGAGVLRGYRSEAAMQAAAAPNFDPWSFVRSSDTLYITAPGTDQDLVAPIVVALLDQIRRATYARGPGHQPVVFALDEVAHIAPLADLPQIVSEGASQGLVTLACLQDLSQAWARWGQLASGFFSYFGAKVILPGIEDLATLELVSALAGEMNVPVRSYTRSRQTWSSNRRVPLSVTISTQRRPVLPVAMVASQEQGRALVLLGSCPPFSMHLIAYWYSPWKELIDEVGRADLPLG